MWCSRGCLLLSALVAGGVLLTWLTYVVSMLAPGQAPSAVLHICSPCPRKVLLGLLLRMFYLFGERGSAGAVSLPSIFLLLCLTFTATWQFLLTSCGLEPQMALFPQGRWSLHLRVCAPYCFWVNSKRKSLSQGPLTRQL